MAPRLPFAKARLALLVAGGLASWRPAAAQVDSQVIHQVPPPASAVRPALCLTPELKPDAVIKVHGRPSGDPVIGPLEACDENGLRVGPYAGHSGSVLVPALLVDHMWVRADSRGRGFAWGAAIGVVSGVTVSSLCGGPDSHCSNRITSGLGAGAALAVVGYVFGTFVPRWKHVFPGRRRSSEPPGNP